MNNQTDILIYLAEHGWSDAAYFINGQMYLFNITHVFNDPYSDAMNALQLLLNKQDSSFCWFSEPGGIKIELQRDKCHEKIHIRIYNIITEQYSSDNITDKDIELITNFDIELRQLLILFYYQFKKTLILLENQEYAKNRSHYFPYDDFIKFEKILFSQKIL